MHFSTIIAAAAFVSVSAAKSGECKDTTMTDPDQDLSGCQTIDGDLIISAKGKVIINGPKSVSGSVIVNQTDIESLSSSSLAKIGKDLTIQYCNSLQSISLPFISNVTNVNLLSLGRLTSLTIGSGDTGVDSVSITDMTSLADVSGINFNNVKNLKLSTNKALISFKSDLQAISGNLFISTNGVGNMSVSLPKLEKLYDATINGVGSFDVPSLKKVSKLRFAENNNLVSFKAGNLTQVVKGDDSGSLSFTRNPKLTMISFPNVASIEGDLTIANNTALKNVTGFPKLESILGALVLGGNFSTVDLPKLTKVNGVADVRSFSVLDDDFCTKQFKDYKSTNPKCEGNASAVASGNGSTITKDGKGGKNGNGDSGASAVAMSFSAMTLALLVGAAQLL